MGFLNKILDKFTSGNALYFPGCLTRFAAPELEEKYVELLNRMNVDFIKISEFNCCGSPVYNAGYHKDFSDLKEINEEIFKKYGISKIISNCPSCCLVFKEKYGLKVEHVSEIFHKNIKKISSKAEDEEIVYHDPCHLGRKLDVYQEPRNVLRALGYEVLELPSCKNDSMCCGGGAGLRSNNPAMAKEIAKRLLLQAPSKKIVTTCPLCYKHLKDNAPKGYEVFELSELMISEEELPLQDNEEKNIDNKNDITT